MDPDDIEPSPLKNFVGGTGCGCGCIGMLGVFSCILLIFMIAQRFFPPEYGSMLGTLSAIGIATGILLAILGGVMWLASLFLD